MAKNAPKSLIAAPSLITEETVVLSTTDKPSNRLITAELNSTGTAVAVKITLFIGTETEKQDGEYSYSDSGSLDLPESITIDGIEYWLNVRNNWQKRQNGTKFKIGRKSISLSVKKPKAAKTENKTTQDIPF